MFFSLFLADIMSIFDSCVKRRKKYMIITGHGDDRQKSLS